MWSELSLHGVHGVIFGFTDCFPPFIHSLIVHGTSSKSTCFFSPLRPCSAWLRSLNLRKSRHYLFSISIWFLHMNVEQQKSNTIVTWKLHYKNSFLPFVEFIRWQYVMCCGWKACFSESSLIWAPFCQKYQSHTTEQHRNSYPFFIFIYELWIHNTKSDNSVETEHSTVEYCYHPLLTCLSNTIGKYVCIDSKNIILSPVIIKNIFFTRNLQHSFNIVWYHITSWITHVPGRTIVLDWALMQ